MIKEIMDKNLKENIASYVLKDLPEWFGIEAYTKDYIDKSKNLVFFAKYIQDDIVGFISLKETSQYTIEIFCMGVIKMYHRLGYGRQLFDEAKKFAENKGYKFMQVKTVEQGKYHIYDLTNAFYKSLGFYELEMFPTLWDEWNPCQILIKAI